LSSRDDFSIDVKRALSNRVANICSNPTCSAPTSGPHTDPSKALNVGVAAHITAAASGGPRFDSNLTALQRRHASNGIWLCQTCGRKVDADDSAHTVRGLLLWKSQAETRANSTVGKARPVARAAVVGAAPSRPGPRDRVKEGILLRFKKQHAAENHVLPPAWLLVHFFPSLDPLEKAEYTAAIGELISEGLVVSKTIHRAFNLALTLKGVSKIYG